MSVVHHLETAEQQRELFLWKFGDVPRADVNDWLKDFLGRDTKNLGEIEEFDVLYILERRGTAKTATELRQMIADMDKDHNHKISFLELCCAMFGKSYDDLNDFVDEDARKLALEAAMKASEAARAAEEEIEHSKRNMELAAQIRAAAIDRESRLTGVARSAAFFTRQIENATDVTKSNADRIKEEAAKRRALREAKTALKEALENANKKKSAEEIANDIRLASEKQAEEEAAKKKKAEEDEKAQRAARKAALNAKWGGTSVPSPVK